MLTIHAARMKPSATVSSRLSRSWGLRLLKGSTQCPINSFVLWRSLPALSSHS